MDWQLLVVGVAVVTAAGFVGRATWRTWVGGCRTGCGKCVTPTPEPSGRRVALPQL
jgi:hypothetical protein